MSLYFKGHHKEIMLEQLQRHGVKLPRSTPVNQVRAVYCRVNDDIFYDHLMSSLPSEPERKNIDKLKAYFNI
jgi:hypothetical protein